MKKRILVTISFSFSIRYLYRTGLLKQLQQVYDVVIAIAWDEPALINELRQDGFEVHIIPEVKVDADYSAIRKRIDYWFNAFCLKSNSAKIQENYLNQYVPFKIRALRKARKNYNYIKLLVPGYKKKLFEDENKLLVNNQDYKNFIEWVAKLKIDAAFTVTPFHKQEDFLLRACKNAGKKMITAILSFDNITKRGWIPVEYDIYMVWNKYNKDQLNRIYPFTVNKPIHITGAPQFDFYFEKDNLLPVDEWKKIVGLPATDRKIILYAGGPAALFPNEPQYLQHIDNAIAGNTIKDKPVVLFRCHPIDNIERWKEAIGKSENIFFDNSWTGQKTLGNANIQNSDIKKLSSTLAYTDVHINLCSTMTIDGDAFGKPQIGPAYDEKNPSYEYALQKMYLQEHFLPVVKTGKLMLAKSKEQLIQYINQALNEVRKPCMETKKIVKEVITYTDGQCTNRVKNVITNYL